MVAKKGQPAQLGYRDMRETVDAFLKAGTISGASRILGLHRATVQQRLDAARRANLIGKDREAAPQSRWRPADEIIEARKKEFKRVAASAPGLGENVIRLEDDSPFMVIAFGDPHLDNPGTDLELFEYWAGFLDREKRITGLLMGDILDNWVKPLAHLYATAETPAPEGWLLFQHYLDQMAPHLDGSVGGNHDAWSGHSDLLGQLLGEKGVLHRPNSLRFVYRTKQGREVSFTLRHSWPGRSMWNEVHGIKRAARMGVRDTVLLGGHTHVSGESVEKCPVTGRLTWCVQAASFKIVDDYADTLGFHDRARSPAVALVIDPRRADTDPELVKVFYDPKAASDYLQMLRSQC